MSILIYIITGVQYWVTDYLDQILGIKSQKDRLFLFTVACFSAPVMGVLIGTEIKNKFCQQNMQKSLIFCSILGILAIINSVPEEHIASANSMTNLITNALGYLPSPYVYGILSDIKGDLGVLGMKVTMWIAIPGMFFLCLATYISLKDDTYKNKIV